MQGTTASGDNLACCHNDLGKFFVKIEDPTRGSTIRIKISGDFSECDLGCTTQATATERLAIFEFPLYVTSTTFERVGTAVVDLLHYVIHNRRCATAIICVAVVDRRDHHQQFAIC